MRKLILRFLAWVYRLCLVFSQSWHRGMPCGIKKVPARVISVGNITWGGTGKTPLVTKLARDLSYYGKRVVVLVRGYGKDEVEELRKNLPHIPILVGRDRVRTARRAVKQFNAEYILLDDGFQHIRLHRDLDIVNINAAAPFGPGGLTPMGTLREPLENLARADIFMLTKSNIGSKNLHWIRQKLLSIKPNAVIFEAVHKPLKFTDGLRNSFVPLSGVKGKRVAVLSGIGDPHSFEKTVENLGAEILFAARFDDHHPFTPSEIGEFIRRCGELQLREVITTEKDFYRLEPALKKTGASGRAPLDFYILHIEFQVGDEEDFIRRCVNSAQR
ncbi:MAG: tetraacyldisaccharide 4'-kinase [Candidatus Omnitrophica bacterium]|nr:tetraacyldisaccharide 4'-kinase [Candidatus Omnitrophota bacterium]